MPKILPLGNAPQNDSISTADLKSMIERYKLERIVHFPETLKEDTTSVWISKSKLLEFFNVNPGSNGIRFYFSIVNDPNIDFDVHNLVLVPTVGERQDTSNDEDFVLITQNQSPTIIEDNTVDVLMCPPPRERCHGRLF